MNTAVDAGRRIVLGTTRIPVKLVTDAISGIADTVSVVGQIANAVLPWSGAINVDPNSTSKGVGAGVPGMLSL